MIKKLRKLDDQKPRYDHFKTPGYTKIVHKNATATIAMTPGVLRENNSSHHSWVFSFFRWFGLCGIPPSQFQTFLRISFTISSLIFIPLTNFPKTFNLSQTLNREHFQYDEHYPTMPWRVTLSHHFVLFMLFTKIIKEVQQVWWGCPDLFVMYVSWGWTSGWTYCWVWRLWSLYSLFHVLLMWNYVPLCQCLMSILTLQPFRKGNHAGREQIL